MRRVSVGTVGDLLVPRRKQPMGMRSRPLGSKGQCWLGRLVLRTPNGLVWQAEAIIFGRCLTNCPGCDSCIWKHDENGNFVAFVKMIHKVIKKSSSNAEKPTEVHESRNEAIRWE